MSEFVTEAPWGVLRQLTPARIATGRAGHSVPTMPHLEFQLAHALARKAVHHPLDINGLAAALLAGTGPLFPGLLQVESAAKDRPTYLQRPDLGRRLSDEAQKTLEQHQSAANDQGYDLVFVIADGLSALAIEENAIGFLQAMLPIATEAGLTIGPFVLVRGGRVAIGDAIGHTLKARQVVVLIGERPGLSSPDSMGLYFTHAPRPDLSDEARNCISNVRKAGQSWQEAANRLWYLLTEAGKIGYSGVRLKDETETLSFIQTADAVNFLLPDG